MAQAPLWSQLHLPCREGGAVGPLYGSTYCLNHWEGTRAWTWARSACVGAMLDSKEELGTWRSTWLEGGGGCIL